MTGRELKEKLDKTDLSQAEIARRLDVIPQSMTQYFKAADVGTNTLERLCEALGVDMSFFYNIETQPSDMSDKEKDNKIRELQEEIDYLREELRRKDDPEQPKKESEVYRLWMENMRITEKMQELYQKEKEG